LQYSGKKGGSFSATEAVRILSRSSASQKKAGAQAGGKKRTRTGMQTKKQKRRKDDKEKKVGRGGENLTKHQQGLRIVKIELTKKKFRRTKLEIKKATGRGFTWED